MFPSASDGLFGIFVKNFKTEMEKQGVVFSKTALIKGQAFSPFKKSTNYLVHYLRVVRGFFTSGHDLIYAHYVTHHIPIFLLLLPFKTKPWVLNAHGNDIIDLQKSAALNFLAKILFKKIDLLVVPTLYFEQKLLENYSFLSSKKIFISPSGGIDPRKFYVKNEPATYDPQSGDHSSQLTAHTSHLTLGFIARFIEEKGWKTFLDALVLLKKRNIYFKAIIVGKGPDENRIKTYIRKNDLFNCVDFRGFVKQEKLVDIYDEIDLYIFPTYRESESLGLTGVEAMTCGTPVISCNVAGPSTYVKHGKNGFLFEPKDHKTLADLIEGYFRLSKEEKMDFQENALETAAGFEQGLIATLLIERLKKL